jgi:signal transduction histidine kinase
VLSGAAVAGLPYGGSPAAVAAAAVCGLAATTSVGGRGRAPEAAVVVAGAGLVGYARLAPDGALLAVAFALLLTSYAAGARGISRRQIGQLGALVGYGIAAIALATAAAGPFSVSATAARALPLSVAPAVAGLLVARQRALAARLAAAAERLRAEQAARLAVVAIRERNRIARDLHDVVTHGVSVMVVQAGAARITADEEPALARAALGEVTGAGRTALAELRRILGVIGAGDDDATGPPFGLSEIVALVERRRAGGLPVQVTVTGTEPGRPAPVLPAQVDVAAYRLVQEALTNVVKHGRSAATEVALTFQPGTLGVQVRNGAPDTAGATFPAHAAALAGAAALNAEALAGSGRGMTGMRDRVESCGGRLRYGAEPEGGFAVCAEFPLPATGPRAEYPAAGTGGTVSRAVALLQAVPGRRSGRAGPRTAAVLALAAGSADAWASADRTGPLALNIALVAGLSLALLWRRRAPLAFLVAVNLLALPISNGLTSINNPTLVSTYVFAVPVWTVAAWSAAPAAVAGLALTAGFYAGEGLYWHLGTGSVGSNVAAAAALWIAGRVLRGQRLMAADLRRTNTALEAEQRAREALTLAEERARLMARLHTLVAEEVSAMIVAAESVRELVGTEAGAAAASIGEIERTGRQSLTQLREILGVLRSEYDPEPLPV